MKIGIDASRAFGANPTGIEIYALEVIRNLRTFFEGEEVVLYVRKGAVIPFDLPAAWRVREIGWTYLWTQGGLSWEMFFHPIDVLFVPAHTLPFVHPRQSVVVVHGLEYEKCPEGYSFVSRMFLRLFTKYSVRAASRVIAVSEATKRDVVGLYGVDEGKISVVYEGGVSDKGQVTSDMQREAREIGMRNVKLGLQSRKRVGVKNSEIWVNSRDLSPVTCPLSQGFPCFLFIGRLETRKNVVRMVQAFGKFRERSRNVHRLVLAGSPGYGYGAIRKAIETSPFREDIIESGYVSEEEKRELLRNAEALLFLSLAEGFGLPVLEAQAVGVPVVCSDIPVLREISGGAALFADPMNAEDMVEKMHRATRLREDTSMWRGGIDMVELGRRNAERFSWETCVRKIAGVISR